MPTQYVLFADSGQHQKLVEKVTRKDHMVNINGCDDEFYRYKMPPLVCVVLNAGASKMVKTSLVNIDDVGKSLQRPPGYLSNYIGYTISAKSEYDKKKVAGENCHVSGHLKAADLNPIVTQFIKDWVLCPKCNNPELNMTLKKKKRIEESSIKFDCSACGYSGKQKKEIMMQQQSLCAYIYKNPPPISGTQKIDDQQRKDEEEALAKKDKKDKKKKDKAKGDGTPRSPKPAGDGAEPAAEEPAAEEPSEAATAVEQSPAEKLATVVAEGGDVATVAAEVSADLKMLLDAMAAGGMKKAAKAIKTNAKVLSKKVPDEAAQKEALAWLNDADVSEPKATAFILKIFYESDIAEEDVILAWAETAKPEVQTAVQPIIEWLEEEDEDDDDEDE